MSRIFFKNRCLSPIKQQLGRVIPLRDMINWCLQNPLEGETLKADDPRMVAIESYIAYERRGVPMAPGKH